MGARLNTISIKGFKSIRDLNAFTLRPLNVLIGANGAGKSNFVDFFRMLRAMSDEGLANFVRDGGGADGFFFDGPKVTSSIKGELAFAANQFRFELTTTPGGEMTVKKEETYWTGGYGGWRDYGGGRAESLLKSWRGEKSHKGDFLSIQGHVSDAVSSWIVYHFHDTSSKAQMRRDHSVRNWRELCPDAANVAAFLYRMRGGDVPQGEGVSNMVFPWEGVSEGHYQRIRQVVQLIAPFFDDFVLEPQRLGDNEVIRLEWRQKGSTFPFQPWQFSDGTLRFICLATALLQPRPPSTIVIDEPELGLHPFALELLASLIKEVATRTQIIVSTQSPAFLNAFEPEDVIVVDRVKGASSFRRLDTASLGEWLGEYTLGELVQKNVIEAGPGEQLSANAQPSGKE